MINFPLQKIYNSYILETYNYSQVKDDIKRFAIALGFEEKLVNSDNHPDICYIENDSEKIKIDEIREHILDTVPFAPQIAERKFYIIYDAANLDINIQNAMLKTLEEPPAFDVFFLVTANVKKLLSTVISRCIILKDNEDRNVKKIVGLDYLADALFILSNAKHETASSIMAFASKFEDNVGMLKDLLMIYRYALRDAIVYKKTLSKDMIQLREKENEIIDISNAYEFAEIGEFIDRLDYLASIINLPINKKIALYNFYNIV